MLGATDPKNVALETMPPVLHILSPAPLPHKGICDSSGLFQNKKYWKPKTHLCAGNLCQHGEI